MLMKKQCCGFGMSLERPNYAINSTPEQALRSNRAILPARVIAALGPMRHILCIAIAFLVNDAASGAMPSQARDQELSLGGIALDDTEATVLNKLGQPRRTTDTGDFLNIRMDYFGLTVWLGEGRRVGEILSTSKQHCTLTRVCPGMPFYMVKERYGSPLVANREDGTFMEYPSSQSACWLQFAVSKGIVKSVRAKCQP
jgi:hypothetical protein